MLDLNADLRAASLKRLHLERLYSRVRESDELTRLRAENARLRAALEGISQGRGACEQYWCANCADEALAGVEVSNG